MWHGFPPVAELLTEPALSHRKIADVPASPKIQSGLVSRRGLATLAVTGGAALLLPARRGLAAVPEALSFAVYRKGDRIGEHNVTFEPKGTGFIARTAVNLVVKAAFIVVFRFEQNATDTWEDGTLVRSQISTNDDGKKTEVSVARNGQRLVGTGPNGPIDAPLGIMNDLSWWNIGVTEADQVLDSEHGDIDALRVTGPTEETIDVAGRQVRTRRFDATMGTTHKGSNWYDANGRWVKTVFTTRGEELEYRLQ
jgi:hypothetical protein